MRLFIAINFDEDTKQQLLAVQSRLRESARGNFSRPENLHLTLAFLGELSPDCIPELQQTMVETGMKSLTFSFTHIGRFHWREGDLWWIGLEKNSQLEELQGQLCQKLKNKGFSVDSKKFTPHITLARQVHLTGPLEENLLLPASFPTKVRTMSLMVSERVNGKLTYTEIGRVESEE